ncbi:hypothetical protein CC2G_002999 [Coprinopsis cinerea AmutBmut pab1-1]|nr:hypothetical protein CC2G_002999 [Coprinopsis cinerea AmutBmut pab1-1]
MGDGDTAPSLFFPFMSWIRAILAPWREFKPVVNVMNVTLVAFILFGFLASVAFLCRDKISEVIWGLLHSRLRNAFHVSETNVRNDLHRHSRASILIIRQSINGVEEKVNNMQKNLMDLKGAHAKDIKRVQDTHSRDLKQLQESYAKDLKALEARLSKSEKDNRAAVDAALTNFHHDLHKERHERLQVDARVSSNYASLCREIAARNEMNDNQIRDLRTRLAEGEAKVTGLEGQWKKEASNLTFADKQLISSLVTLGEKVYMDHTFPGFERRVDNCITRYFVEFGSAPSPHDGHQADVEKVIDNLPWPVKLNVRTKGFACTFTELKWRFNKPEVLEFLKEYAEFLQSEGHGPERMERVVSSLTQCFDSKVWEEKGYLGRICRDDVREMFVKAAGAVKDVLDSREWVALSDL